MGHKGTNVIMSHEIGRRQGASGEAADEPLGEAEDVSGRRAAVAAQPETCGKRAVEPPTMLAPRWRRGVESGRVGTTHVAQRHEERHVARVDRVAAREGDYVEAGMIQVDSRVWHWLTVIQTHEDVRRRRGRRGRRRWERMWRAWLWRRKGRRRGRGRRRWW